MNELDYRSAADRPPGLGLLAWICLGTAAAGWIIMGIAVFREMPTYGANALVSASMALCILSLFVGIASIATGIIKKRSPATFVVAAFGLILALIPLISMLGLWWDLKHGGLHR